MEEYQAYVAAANESKQATEDFANSLSTTLAEAAESTSEAIDNSVMDPSKYAAGLEARVKAAQDYQANVQSIGEQLPGDLFDFVREQGPGFSEEIATYLSASPEQKARIEAGWKIAAQVEGDTKDLDAKTSAKGRERKKGPTSEIKGDTKDVDQKVKQKSEQKAKGPTSQIRADDSDVDKALKRLREKIAKGPTVQLRVDQSAVDSALTTLSRRVVTVQVKAVP